MTRVLIVPDMTCAHCQASVTGALQRLAGVSDVSVDLTSKRVTVGYDERQVSEASLRRAVEDAGFEVSEMNPR